MNSEMLVSRKRVLVTGAASGIGKAISQRFSKGDVELELVDVNVAGLEQVSILCSPGSPKIALHQCDVSDFQAIQAVVASIEDKRGPIDAVVASAGIWIPNRIGDHDLISVRRTVDVNLFGCYNLVDAVAPRMLSRGKGSIVLISSAAGTRGFPNGSAYAMSKAAVNSLVASAAAELGRSGIRINAIAPGNTRTPINESLRLPENRSVLDFFAAITPSNRVFSEPEDIAEIAYFLTSDASVAVRGQCIVADEGLTLAIPPVPGSNN